MLRHTIYTMQAAKTKPCQSIPDYLRDNEIDFTNVRQALRWQPVFLLSSSKRKLAQSSDPDWSRIAITEDNPDIVELKHYQAESGKAMFAKFHPAEHTPAIMTREQFLLYIARTFGTHYLPEPEGMRHPYLMFSDYCANYCTLPLKPDRSKFADLDDPIWDRLAVRYDLFQEFIIYGELANYFHMLQMTPKTKNIWATEERQYWDSWMKSNQKLQLSRIQEELQDMQLPLPEEEEKREI